MDDGPERPAIVEPFTSEAAAFRLLVIVIVGAALVIAAALVIDPAVGAVVLAAEILAAGWALVRARTRRRAGSNRDV